MKKLLLVAGTIALLAASCNMQTAVKNSDEVPQTTQTKVDAAASAAISGIEAEDSINMQSDDDVINSDKDLINNYEGAANETSF